MFYLHVKTQPRPAAGSCPSSNTHGPFATQQEAAGFFTKLTIWYPSAMKEAAYNIIRQADQEQATRRLTSH